MSGVPAEYRENLSALRLAFHLIPLSDTHLSLCLLLGQQNPVLLPQLISLSPLLRILALIPIIVLAKSYMLAQVYLLLDGLAPMIDKGINDPCYCEDASDDSAHAGQEVQEAHLRLMVLDLQHHMPRSHRFDACCMQRVHM